MKVAIVGSRTISPHPAIIDHLVAALISVETGELINSSPVTAIVSGGARGVDYAAKKYAKHILGVEYIDVPAEWDKHGKSAGFIRNTDIVEKADVVLAIWDGKSRGTKDTIDKAKSAGKGLLVWVPGSLK